jgi:hypothetical protein
LAASVDRPPAQIHDGSRSFRSESVSALTSTPSSLSRISRRSKRSTCPRCRLPPASRNLTAYTGSHSPRSLSAN